MMWTVFYLMTFQNKKIINNIFDDEKYLELVENSYQKINSTYHINVVLKKEYAIYKGTFKNSS